MSFPFEAQRFFRYLGLQCLPLRAEQQMSWCIAGLPENKIPAAWCNISHSFPSFLYFQNLASFHCCHQHSYSCAKNHCNNIQTRNCQFSEKKKKKSYINSSLFWTNNSFSWFPFAAESRQPISPQQAPGKLVYQVKK